MPNTPVVVRNGVTIFTQGSAVKEGDRDLVNQLLASVGICHEMDEYYMDIITGLTGCGPAYVSIRNRLWLEQQLSLFSSDVYDFGCISRWRCVGGSS